MKKTLAIIIAILMLVTMIPFTPVAFAADDYAVVDTEAGTLTIDGTFGGKAEATDDEVAALTETIKDFVTNGGSAVIVTGSEMAIHDNGYYDNYPAYADALYYVTDASTKTEFNGKVDLILPEATTLVEYEFDSIYCLRSITLPKVTTIGDGAFYSCFNVETLTFGSVITSVGKNAFSFLGDPSGQGGGTDLVLNCGQKEGNYIPDIDKKEWCYHQALQVNYTWKSITLTHTPEADDGDCTTAVMCSACGEIAVEAKVSHTTEQEAAKAPTCTEIGWDAYEYCTACDYTTYDELPAINHTDANCDYKCDYNCGYEYETLDFSDAKVLTTVDGVLYIDGVEAETNSSKSQSRIYEGKYILEGDIETSRYIWIFGDTYLDLNGYTWNLTKYINVNAPLSVYDTSEAETGKITSASSNLTININDVAAGFNLYGGTIENTSSSGRYVLDVSSADVNLYAGKIKSNSQAIYFVLGDEITLNIDGTVLESGDDYADVLVALGINDIAKGDIDVTDYKGDSLTAKVNVISTLGKITVFKGIKNTQEAEKYQIIDVVCNESFDLFWEKTEYDEATGEKSIYTANNAFTQQPSAENGYTVDFNNSDATFQWYEVEETVLTPDNVTSIDGDFENDKWSYGGWYAEFFTVDVKAGDMITASTTSARSFDLIVYTEDYSINEYVRTTGKASVTIDSDAEVIVGIDVDNVGPTEFEFELIKISEMDETETDKTLQNPECGKTYVCKTSVGENVYLSDVVTVGHNIVSVDAKAPTCTEIGWDAYEYCTGCDYTTYVELPADPDAHTPLEAVKENEVAPKCDVTGSYDLVVYCACGEELDRDTKTVDALTHTDADGDYICDNGCGHEFEKPAPEEPTPEEPTPEEPAPDEPTEDTICEDCGKVHDGFFAELICFFTRIINFIKNLFA